MVRGLPFVRPPLGALRIIPKGCPENVGIMKNLFFRPLKRIEAPSGGACSCTRLPPAGRARGQKRVLANSVNAAGASLLQAHTRPRGLHETNSE